MLPLLDGEGGGAMRGFRISYIRLLVITLLAIACGFLIKVKMFSNNRNRASEQLRKGERVHI